MKARMRGVAMLAPAAAAALMMLSATAADAAPYTDDPSGTVSDANPEEGAQLTIDLDGYESLERIGLDLHSKVVRLATVRADAQGSATVTVTLPMGFTCEHFIEARGLSSGLVTRIDLVIGDASDCRDDSAGGEDDSDDGTDLPATGAAVGGLAAAGALMTAAGIVLVRRRRS